MWPRPGDIIFSDGTVAPTFATQKAMGETPGLFLAQDVFKGDWVKRFVVIPEDNVEEFMAETPNDLNLYEIIRKGKPCRLYFDLDGKPEKMAEHEALVANPSAVIDELRNRVQAMLAKTHPATDATRVVVLQSDRQDLKFSYHVQFPDVVFADNQHMQAWAEELVHTFQTGASTLSKLVDKVVYSNNRQWRMKGQSKGSDPAKRVMRSTTAFADTLVGVGQLQSVGLKFTTKRRKQGKALQQVLRLKVPKDWTPPTIFNTDPVSLLSCIPPSAFPEYHPWVFVMLAFKNIGGTKEQFIEWNNDGPRAQSADVERWSYQGRCGYPFLLNTALHFSPKVLKVHLCQKAYGFYTGKLKTKFIDQPYLRDRTRTDVAKLIQSRKEKCFLIKSRCGSGKTFLAKWITGTNPGAKILYVVSSVPLNYTVKQEMNAEDDDEKQEVVDEVISQLNEKVDDRRMFKSYKDTNKSLCDCNRLVVTIQSFWRVYGGSKQVNYFDIVIFDEIASCVEDLLGPTSKRTKLNMDQLQRVLTAPNLRQCFLLDAHVKTSERLFSQLFFKDEDIYIIWNKNKGPRKLCRKLPPPMSTKKMVKEFEKVEKGKEPDWGKLQKGCALYTTLDQMLKKNQNVFVVCNRNDCFDYIEQSMLTTTWLEAQVKQAVAANETLRDNKDLQRHIASFLVDKNAPRIRYESIRKDDDHPAGHFTNDKINIRWVQQQLLMFSPKITQGISFTQKHFNVGFVIATVMTLLPRRVLQQIARIRCFAKNPFVNCPLLYLSMNVARKPKTYGILGLPALKKRMESERHFAQTLTTQFAGWEPDEKWKEIYMHVQNERETFVRFPNESIDYWLTHDGFTIEVADEELKRQNVVTKRPEVHSNRTPPLHQVKTIDTKTFMRRQRCYDLTKDERYEVQRHEFENKYFGFDDSADDPGDWRRCAKEVLWKLFVERRRRVFLAGYVRFMDKTTVADMFYRERNVWSKGSGFIEMVPGKVKHLHELQELAGIDNIALCNNEALSSETFGRLLDWVKQNEKDIQTVWALKRDFVKEDDGTFTNVLNPEKWLRAMLRAIEVSFGRVDDVRESTRLKTPSCKISKAEFETWLAEDASRSDAFLEKHGTVTTETKKTFLKALRKQEKEDRAARPAKRRYIGDYCFVAAPWQYLRQPHVVFPDEKLPEPEVKETKDAVERPLKRRRIERFKEMGAPPSLRSPAVRVVAETSTWGR